jgi:hypothetical protein
MPGAALMRDRLLIGAPVLNVFSTVGLTTARSLGIGGLIVRTDSEIAPRTTGTDRSGEAASAGCPGPRGWCPFAHAGLSYRSPPAARSSKAALQALVPGARLSRAHFNRQSIRRVAGIIRSTSSGEAAILPFIPGTGDRDDVRNDTSERVGSRAASPFRECPRRLPEVFLAPGSNLYHLHRRACRL